MSTLPSKLWIYKYNNIDKFDASIEKDTDFDELYYHHSLVDELIAAAKAIRDSGKVTPRYTQSFAYLKQNKMIGTVEIKQIDQDTIEILGKIYFTQEYSEEMMRSEYQRGIKEGQHIHIAQVELINQPEP